MDAVLRNFKSIPCPAGDACTVKGCQWQHSWDANTDSADRDGARDDDGPRKRQKISQSASAASSPSTMTRDTLKRKAHSPVPAKEQPRKAVKTANASGTTAVLVPSKVVGRADVKVTGTPPSKSQSSVRNVGSGSPAPASKVATAKSSSPPKPRKPESLNPRHLPSAPATHDFRHKVLKLLHEQYVRLNNEAKKRIGDDKEKAKKILRSPQGLIWLALDEEERVATGRPAIYNNMIKNRVMEYKKMTLDSWMAEQEKGYEARRQEAQKRENDPDKAKTGADPGTSTPKMEAHSAPQLGPPVVINTGLAPEQEVQMLTRLATPMAKLAQHGYVATVPTDEEIANARQGEEASRGYEVCDRCKTRFQVFPGRREEDGALASGGKCTHHYGKSYVPPKAPGDRSQVPKRWKCCGEAVGDSVGCYTGDSHVFKVTSAARLACVVPFVETPPNARVPKDRAVAFDCEMGYTVRGMELIRLTVVSWPAGEALLDVLVRPVGEVLDLNSRYSGVWPEDIVNAKPYTANTANTGSDASKSNASSATRTTKALQIVSSPAVARDLLFSLVAPETPLIGHGLENDLNAVRIVHPNIVDSVLLYPHPRGLPMRNGLKALMERHLNKRIQVDVDAAGKAVVGHDSAEDARAAGELVRLAVANEWDRMRREGWKLVDKVFVPPGAASRDGLGDLTEGFLEAGDSGSGRDQAQKASNKDG